MALPEVGLTAVIDNLNKFEQGAKAITTAYDDIDKKGTSVAGSTVALGNSLLNIGAIASGAVLAGITALGVALTGFAVGGIQKATDLDQRMANIAATAGVAKDQVGGLKDLIFDLSLNPDLVVNTNQAADAIEVLLANGAKLTDEFGNVTAAGEELATQVVAMSNATGGDFALSASIATDATNVFGLATEDLSKVVDGATGVMVASKFGAEDYALALAQAGGIAGGMGVKIEDFNTVIAATASNFSSGGDAGTSFKTFLQRLAAPTGKMKNLMAELGISLFDSSGNMRSMSEVVGQLHDALGPLTEAQRAEIAAELGGADAARTVIALAQMTEGEFAKLSGTVNKQGQALSAAATRVDSLSGAWEVLQGVIESIQIQAGEAFLPLLRQITTAFIDLATQNGPMVIGFFEQIASSISNLITFAQSLFAAFQSGGVGGLVGALGLTPATTELINKISESISGLASVIVSTLMPSFMALSSGNILDTINSAIEFLNANFEAFKGAILGVGSVLAGAAIAALIAGIGTAIVALATPITAIIAIAALLGAAWGGNWFGIRDATIAVWGVVQPILAQLWGWIQSTLPTALQYLASVWTSVLLPALTAVWQFVSGTLFPLWLQLQQILITVVGAGIQNLANQWTNVLLPALNLAWQFMSTSILPLLSSIGNVINAVVNKSLEAMAGLWQNVLLPALTAVGSYIASIFQPALSGLGLQASSFAPILDAVAAGFNGITTALQSATTFFNNFANSVNAFELPYALTSNSPTPLEVGLSGIASVLRGPLSGAFDTFAKGGSVSVKNLNTVLTNELTLTLTTIEEIIVRTFTRWEQLILFVQTKITSLLGTLTQLQARSSQASSTITTGFNSANTALNTTAARMTTIATNISSISINAASATVALANMSKVGFDSLIEKLADVRSRASGIGNAFEEAREQANALRSVSFSAMLSQLNSINNAIENIIESFEEMASAADDASESAADALDAGAGGNFRGLAGRSALNSIGVGNGIAPAVSTPTSGTGGNVTNVTMYNSFGGNTLGSNMDLAQFDQMVLRSLQRLMA